MNQPTIRRPYLPNEPVWQSLTVGMLVLGACLLGIATRLLFDLASFWPANALFFGILVLRPETNRPLTWLAGTGAYFAADFLAGTSLSASAWLNSANVAGVLAGTIIFRMMPRDLLRLDHPSNSVVVVLILALASGATALVGTLAGPLLYDISVGESLALWFSTEFVNYALTFPILTAMVSRDEERFRFFSRNRSVAIRQAAALVFLACSYAVMHVIGGPGAITFVLPALGWVAVRFRPMATAALTLLICTGLLVSGQNGFLHLHFDVNDVGNAASYRFGIAMVAIMTFALSMLNAAWRRVHHDLQWTSRQDALTGLLNRAAFIERAQAALNCRCEGEPISLLMLDIDHFKSVNDRFGHAGGDVALTTTARALSNCLRANDIIGRLGGEEFAVILPGVDAIDAENTAERLRRAVADLDIALPDGQGLTLTISVGGAETRARDVLAGLMSTADAALYAAKHAGRNRVIMVPHNERQARSA